LTEEEIKLAEACEQDKMLCLHGVSLEPKEGLIRLGKVDIFSRNRQAGNTKLAAAKQKKRASALRYHCPETSCNSARPRRKDHFKKHWKDTHGGGLWPAKMEKWMTKEARQMQKATGGDSDYSSSDDSSDGDHEAQHWQA